MVIGLIIAALLAGGVTYGAEGSLPGDVLYPIKVEINERAMSAIALSAQADAKVQIRLAERRMEEAEDLDSEGSLDAETAASLNAAFGMHIKLAQEHLKELKDSGDEEAYAEAFAEFKVLVTSHGEAVSEAHRSDTAASIELHDFLEGVGMPFDDDDFPGAGDDNGMNSGNDGSDDTQDEEDDSTSSSDRPRGNSSSGGASFDADVDVGVSL